MSKFIGGLLVLAALVVICVVASVVDGYVAMQLWNWFMVPIGQPAIRLVHAIGLGLVACVLTNHLQPRKLKSLSETLGAVFIGPFIVLFVGYVVHSFM